MHDFLEEVEILNNQVAMFSFLPLENDLKFVENATKVSHWLEKRKITNI